MKKRNRTVSKVGSTVTYREVKCPWCDHVYMWMVSNEDGIHYESAEEKGKWIGRRSKCPKCAGTFAVLDGIFTGIPEEDLESGIKMVKEYYL